MGAGLSTAAHNGQLVCECYYYFISFCVGAVTQLRWCHLGWMIPTNQPWKGMQGEVVDETKWESKLMPIEDFSLRGCPQCILCSLNSMILAGLRPFDFAKHSVGKSIHKTFSPWYKH